MKEIIESIANALGLSHRIVDCYRYGRSCERAVSIAINNREALCHLNAPDWVGLCLFAAYAKAEMAKRGWFLETSCTGRVWATDGSYDFGAISYEPSDPLSEAKAILKCIADTLQSNAQANGR